MGQTWVFVDPLTDTVLIFLAQLALTLAFTRILGKLFSYLKQPQVIGEIIGGILMGPTALGRIPGYTDAIFPTKALLTPTTPYNSVTTFVVIANVGLILFMFMMGLELDQSLMRKNLRYSFPIAISSILFPFGVGAANSLWIYNLNILDTGKLPDKTAFVLFAGSSMSFTAFPVLASILSATKLIGMPIGVQAMSCAAIDDVLAWCTLAIASSFAQTSSPVNGIYVFILAIIYVLTMVFVVRLSLKYCHSYLEGRGASQSRYYYCMLFLVLIGSAYCSEVIGIHAFFGAFLAGLIMPKSGTFTEDFVSSLQLPVTEVFLPLYFVSSGIKTNVGLLNSASDWGYVVAIIVIACVAKFTPACIVSKIVTRRSWRFCTTLGILMNTRGLVEIIALNVGLSMGVLNQKVFTMLVIMAIVTTCLTAPLLYFVYEKDFKPELEGPTAGNVMRSTSMAQGAGMDGSVRSGTDAPHTSNGDDEVGIEMGAATPRKSQDVKSKMAQDEQTANSLSAALLIGPERA